MKNFLKSFSMNVEDKCCKNFQANFMAFIGKHPELFCLSLLAIMCLIFLFIGLDFYPLLDVDETRYAVMARDLAQNWDWNILRLNTEPFLEKPPLYFWIVAGSIQAFGEFSAWIVRLPIALLSSFIVFFTYFVGKKIISRKFGMLSALILLSSMFFLILSHIAIIDMVLTVFMTSAIYCGLLTHFCTDKYKKYCWWYFWLFAGIGFMAKGILAIAIPVLIVFTYNLITKTAKDMFKPLHILPGIIGFLCIILPWHLDMYFEYGNRFIKEYFLVHHFARFVDSANINRERPLLYFIPVFIVGFLPWSFVFIAFLVNGCKKIAAKYKSLEGTVKTKIAALLDVQTNEQKLVLFSLLYFVIIFVVFSVSSTKLPTYILPAFPAAALLTGYYWWVSDEKAEHEASISVSTQLFAAILIIGALVGSIIYWMLPYDLQQQMCTFKSVVIFGMYLLGILLILRLNTKRALSIFSGYILTMLFVITIGISYIFNLIYSGGENEIQQYARLAQIYDGNLVTFDFAVKPSVMVPFHKKVLFLTDPDFDKLNKAIGKGQQSTFVIVKNVNLKDNDYAKKIEKQLELYQSGKRYSLYIKDNEGILDDQFECCNMFEPGENEHKMNNRHEKHKKYIKNNGNADKQMKKELPIEDSRKFLKKMDGFKKTSPFEAPDVEAPSQDVQVVK